MRSEWRERSRVFMVRHGLEVSAAEGQARIDQATGKRIGSDVEGVSMSKRFPEKVYVWLDIDPAFEDDPLLVAEWEEADVPQGADYKVYQVEN